MSESIEHKELLNDLEDWFKKKYALAISKNEVKYKFDRNYALFENTDYFPEELNNFDRKPDFFSINKFCSEIILGEVKSGYEFSQNSKNNLVYSRTRVQIKDYLNFLKSSDFSKKIFIFSCKMKYMEFAKNSIISLKKELQIKKNIEFIHLSNKVFNE